MTYEEFQEQYKTYDALLDARLPAYCQIMGTQAGRYNPYFTFGDDDINMEAYEYEDGGIQVNYSQYIQGCGQDDYSFFAPIALLEMSDEQLMEEYYPELRAKIKADNEDLEKEKKAKANAERKERITDRKAKDIAEYARLQKMFGRKY